MSGSRGTRFAGDGGERIEAFVRAGKLPATVSITNRTRDYSVKSTVLKAGAGIGVEHESKMPAPRKRETRKSMGQSAWITLEGGFAARHCVVQDISSTGAKISLDEAATLPATVRLAFARDARTGHRCQVIWRRGRSAGVKFVR